MTIHTSFDLKDKVTILDLGWHGSICSIWITNKGIEYQVRYFNNGKLEMEYFYEEELEFYNPS